LGPQKGRRLSARQRGGIGPGIRRIHASRRRRVGARVVAA